VLFSKEGYISLLYTNSFESSRRKAVYSGISICFKTGTITWPTLLQLSLGRDDGKKIKRKEQKKTKDLQAPTSFVYLDKINNLSHTYDYILV
jgi:hypothetical protein